MKIKNLLNYKRNNLEPREEKDELFGYESYTDKELFSQPDIIRAITQKYIRAGRLRFDNVRISFDKIKRIYIVGNGCDYACALAGAYNFEVLCDVQSVAESVYEFVYSNPILDKNTLAIVLNGDSDSQLYRRALERTLESRARIIQIGGNSESANSISLDITEQGELTGTSFNAKYLILAMLAVYMGERLNVVTQLYRDVAMNAFCTIDKKLEAVLNAKEVIARAAERLNFDGLVFTGLNVDYAQAIYASEIVSSIDGRQVFALPPDRLDGERNENVIALASCKELHRALPENLKLQMIIQPANIPIGDITSISYEEALPLLNPMISCSVLQLMAYSRLKSKKKDEQKEAEDGLL